MDFLSRLSSLHYALMAAVGLKAGQIVAGNAVDRYHLWLFNIA
jgi:hypothetical protein